MLFFFPSVCLSIEREQKATAAANIIYLGGRICTLCQWTAPGLLCASIHYRHKALDVSPLHLFPALSTRHTSSVRPLRAGGACSPGRWSNGEECQRGRVELTSCVCCAESSESESERLSVSRETRVRFSHRAGVIFAICEGFFSFLPAWLH